jgi:hypothetical protein
MSAVFCWLSGAAFGAAAATSIMLARHWRVYRWCMRQATESFDALVAEWRAKELAGQAPPAWFPEERDEGVRE